MREDQVIKPDGQPGIYGVVDTRLATGVVAFTEALEVVLVGQYRYPLDCYSWEIVEGGSDQDENPLDTIKRELREEAGLSAAIWLELGPEIHLSNCFSSERGYLYMACGLRPAPVEPDPNEILQVAYKPIGECMRMVEQGLIKDTMSVVGLYRAKTYLEYSGGRIPI